MRFGFCIFTIVMNSIEKGRRAEDFALEWLTKRGLSLLERNFRVGHKEIDLIMESRDRLHIIEVKSLEAPSPIFPDEQVDLIKRRNLISAAAGYVAHSHTTKEVQFDIVSVMYFDGRPELEYIPEAFYPLY